MSELLTSLVVCYLLILPFGQIWKIPTPWQEVNIYLTDMIIGMIFLSWITIFLFKQGLKRNFPSTLKLPIAAVGFIMLSSWIYSNWQMPWREIAGSGFYLLRWISYASLFPVVHLLTSNQISRQTVKTSLLLSLGLMVTFGWLQYWLLPDLKYLASYGWDEHYYRLVGTFLDPGFTGILLVMGWFLIFPKVNSPQNNLSISRHISKLGVVALAGIFITMAFTYSRASYLAWIMGMLILSWRQKSWKIAGVSLALIVALWFLLPRPAGEGGNLARVSTIKHRLVNYSQSLTIISGQPLLGVGFNRYRYVQREYGFLDSDSWQSSHAGAGADNSWLFMLATTGIIGLLCYIWLFYSLGKYVFSSSYLFALLVAVTVHSQFQNTLFFPAVMGYLWIILGLFNPDSKEEELLSH